MYRKVVFLCDCKVKQFSSKHVAFSAIKSAAVFVREHSRRFVLCDEGKPYMMMFWMPGRSSAVSFFKAFELMASVKWERRWRSEPKNL